MREWLRDTTRFALCNKDRVALWAAFLLIMAAIFAQSYNGRRDVVQTQRQGCHRGIADRAANVASWYAAYLARAATARSDKTTSSRDTDEDAAEVYFNTAWSLNSRVDRGHSLVVKGRYPLGFGRLDCARANPSASPFQFFN